MALVDDDNFLLVNIINQLQGGTPREQSITGRTLPSRQKASLPRELNR